MLSKNFLKIDCEMKARNQKGQSWNPSKKLLGIYTVFYFATNHSYWSHCAMGLGASRYSIFFPILSMYDENTRLYLMVPVRISKVTALSSKYGLGLASSKVAGFLKHFNRLRVKFSVHHATLNETFSLLVFSTVHSSCAKFD